MTTTVVFEASKSVCMYHAPIEPCSHIGVMQLQKNAPKNEKRRRKIESPSGTDRLNQSHRALNEVLRSGPECNGSATSRHGKAHATSSPECNGSATSRHGKAHATSSPECNGSATSRHGKAHATSSPECNGSRSLPPGTPVTVPTS
jgi:hypothetical protein